MISLSVQLALSNLVYTAPFSLPDLKTMLSNRDKSLSHCILLTSGMQMTSLKLRT